MKCPFCSGEESKVVDSRSTEDNIAIRRRRECLSCSRRYTTYEKVEEIPIFVVKRDFTRELFNRDKIMGGIMRACEKRPVTRANIEGIVENIEKSLNNNMISEVSTETIGEMILEKLKNVDEVAYVRFASVYRKFDDINSFMEEIKRLIKDK